MNTTPKNESTGSPEDHARVYVEETTRAKKKYGRFNLAVVGKSGVGKSSLVNAVFGRDLAAVGMGLPVTRGIHYYSDDVLGIWDVEGFETGSHLTPAEHMREYLDTVAKRPANEQISVVWYCVLAGSSRLEQADVDAIRELAAAGLSVMLVVTKVDWSKNPLTGKYSVSRDLEQFVDWLEHPTARDAATGAEVPVHLPIAAVQLTSTRDKNGKGSGHGLGDLVTETLALAPKDDADAFRIAQRLYLPWKRELARPVIAAAAAAAGATAAVPLPVANAAALAPLQLAMMARISAIYDLELKSVMSAGTLAQLAAQFTGQATARGLITMLPGAGSVINAGVATAITAATGEAWMRLCEQVFTGRLDPKKLDTKVLQFAPGAIDLLKQLKLPGMRGR